MRGFTLLELLISITMIGLIALIVTGAVRLGSRSVDGGERRIESIERLKNSLGIIESQILSEIPLSYEEDGNRRYYFQGDGTFVQFTSTYSIWGGKKGYVLTLLRVEVDSNGKRSLKAKEKPLIGGIEAETILFEGFDDIHFEYFYRNQSNEEGKWVSEWTEEGLIPERIKIGLMRDQRDLSLILPIPSRDRQSMTASTALDRKK